MIERTTIYDLLYANCAVSHHMKVDTSRIQDWPRFIRQIGNFLNIYALLERRLIVSEYRLTGRHTFFLLLGFLSRDIHYTRGFISKGFLLVLALEDFRSLGRKP